MPPALRDRYQYYTRAIVERLRSSGYDKSITPLDVAVDDYARKYLMRDCRLDPARAESLAPA
jgi:ADP-L-glycero-D-manno-heptose 6-epimerase